MHDYKNFEITIIILSIVCLYLSKKNRCLHVIHHDSIPIHSLSMHQLLNGCIAELLTISIIFTGVAYTTSIPMGVEDGGGENHVMVGQG